jgi:spore coat polysaccharide biosynthesis protein SpsF (cytidylyltransferase family)/aryl-alcohol dehydrogenase-like predicted oxidoreductase
MVSYKINKNSIDSVVVIQARLNSSRLPGKVLLPINSIPVVVLTANRAGNTGKKVLVATSNERSDDQLCEELQKNHINFFRGSLNNVLGRIVSALDGYNDNTIVFRLTADNVFPDGDLLDELQNYFIKNKSNYLQCHDADSGLPTGLSAEIMLLRSLRHANTKTNLSYDLEHVTPYIRRVHGENLYIKYLNLNLGNYRATIDTFEDYIDVQKAFQGVEDPVNIKWMNLVENLKTIQLNVFAKKPITSLVLGGAQFGMEYGINNSHGMPRFTEISNIIKLASANGIEYIDTARTYGDSEKNIGQVFQKKAEFKLKVITKLDLPKFSKIFKDKTIVEAFVRKSVFNSCVELKTNKLECLMLHRAEYLFDSNRFVLDALIELLNDGYIKSLGVSVQSPEELKEVLKYKEITFIQMPFNLLDYRWEVVLKELDEAKRSRTLNIHVRSIFLQGLFLSDNIGLWSSANVIDPDVNICWLKSTVIKLNRDSLADLCIAYVKSMSWADGIVIGVETEDQLKQNFKYFEKQTLTKDEIAYVNSSRPVLSKKTLDPSCWNIQK